MTSTAAHSTVYTQEGVIRGHHIYKRIWTPFIGEELSLQQERTNRHDYFAVTVMRDGSVVGRVPREFSHAYWTFMEDGGRIKCEVTGQRKRGKGLELPCVYKFDGSVSQIEELKKSYKRKTLT